MRLVVNVHTTLKLTSQWRVFAVCVALMLAGCRSSRMHPDELVTEWSGSAGVLPASVANLEAAKVANASAGIATLPERLPPVVDGTPEPPLLPIAGGILPRPIVMDRRFSDEASAVRRASFSSTADTTAPNQTSQVTFPNNPATPTTTEPLPAPAAEAEPIDAPPGSPVTASVPAVPLLPPPAPRTDENTFNPEGDVRRPIDLPTALRLANANNPLVAFTREQVRQAYARWERADVLWLPSIRAGVNFNRHEGAIQDVRGEQFNTSRGAFYGGLGAGGYGAGSPVVPGVWANFHLADAIFAPLAAEQATDARRGAVGATLNDTWLQVAVTYLELLRSQQELAIAEETLRHAEELARVCRDYAETGEGLWSDADRAATELALRRNQVVRAEEAIAVASARLAQLLRLDPTAQFDPIEPLVVPLEVAPQNEQVNNLIAQGLRQRPELFEARSLVAEALARFKREQYAPFIPSVILGVSDGGLSAGQGTDYAPLANRFDMDIVAYWELRNFGFGDQAARRDTASVVRQNRWRQVQMLDLVAREVTESYAQMQARRQQIAIAEQGVQVAVRSYELNLQRIEDAKGLPIETLQSLQALDQSRREYLRTVIEYNTAQFALLRALGWPT